MHDFCENSQSISPNSSKVIPILQDWELPKYHIGQFVEYEIESEEKHHLEAIITGCEYFPCGKSWDYYIDRLENYLSNSKDFGFLDESQIRESQIIRIIALAEASEII